MPWEYTLQMAAEILGTEVSGASDADERNTFNSVSTDTRTLEPGALFFALEGEQYDAQQFVPQAFEKGAVGVVSRQASDSGPGLVVPDPLQALQKFAAYHRRQCPARVIALTGSCGKTTAKDLIAAVLESRYRVEKTQGNLNNEIGCPLSLMQLQPDTEYAIIEMGANHPGEIRRLCQLARPDEALITLVAPAHLEGFGSIADVARAKGEIVEALGPDGLFYVNTDNSWCVEVAATHPGPQVRVGKQGDVALKSVGFDEDGLMRLDIEPIGVLRLPLRIPAHSLNVLFAVAIGLQHGITDFQTPLTSASANPSRGKFHRLGPLHLLDDSYNANPASMEAALEALQQLAPTGKKIAALGAMLELGETAPQLHRAVGETAARLGVDCLFARGPHACDMIEGALAAGAPHAEVIEDHEAIAHAIYSLASPGDTLLLKGSRGMRMEAIAPYLASLYDNTTQA